MFYIIHALSHKISHVCFLIGCSRLNYVYIVSLSPLQLFARLEIQIQIETITQIDKYSKYIHSQNQQQLVNITFSKLLKILFVSIVFVLVSHNNYNKYHTL